MKLLYYPGCTLRSSALPFDQSAKEIAAALGIDLVEMEDFTCCGTLYPQTTENLMPLLAPARTLVQAQRVGTNGRLMTLCSFCYNTLKRTANALEQDEQKRTTLSDFLEEPYNGTIKIVHFLEVLRDDIGFEAIKEKITRRLEGLRVAPYYGCLLLRPALELGLDDPEEPTLMENLLEALGCEVVDFPARTECCGSFLIVSNPSLAHQCSQRILDQARGLGADIVVTSCPLCQFNLTRRSGQNGGNISVLYFTQVLGLALGIEPDRLALDVSELDLHNCVSHSDSHRRGER